MDIEGFSPKRGDKKKNPKRIYSDGEKEFRDSLMKRIIWNMRVVLGKAVSSYMSIDIYKRGTGYFICNMKLLLSKTLYLQGFPEHDRRRL